MKVLIGYIESVFKTKGYDFFVDGFYNLNIFGVRSPKKKEDLNKFDDFLFVVYQDEHGHWNIRQYPCTTTPGASVLMDPINSQGTAILIPGQYKSAYSVDMHKSSYPALCQRRAEVSVWRYLHDRDLGQLDTEQVYTGYFGINIHKAGIDSTQVDGWSAGCQVISNEMDWHSFWRIVSKGAAIWGPTFTYTLFNASDFQIPFLWD